MKTVPYTYRLSTRVKPEEAFANISEAHDPECKDITREFKISPQDSGSLVERTITVHMSPLMAFLRNLVLFPLINRRENTLSLAGLKA